MANGKPGCTKKRWTKLEAQIKLAGIRPKKKKHRRESRMYYCHQCRAYHLTSRPLKTERSEE